MLVRNVQNKIAKNQNAARHVTPGKAQLCTVARVLRSWRALYR